MAKQISIEAKIKQTRRGYKLFDYFMGFFVLLAIASITKFLTADSPEVKLVEGFAAVREFVIALGFWAIRNLFHTVSDILDELRGTV